MSAVQREARLEKQIKAGSAKIQLADILHTAQARPQMFHIHYIHVVTCTCIIDSCNYESVTFA